MKETISISQLAIQKKLKSDDLLQLAINGSLRLYRSIPGILTIKHHQINDRSGEWELLIEGEITSFIHVAVNADLCRRIYLDGYVKSKAFYSHSGYEAIETDNEILVQEEELFAYVNDQNAFAGKKLTSDMHGNRKPAFKRNQKIFEVVKEEIEKNPFLFCTKSSHKDKRLKLQATKIANHLMKNQAELFGDAEFIKIQHETLVRDVLIEEGFKAGNLDEYVKKPG
mgnify:CR=1 FL=1|tara:strand:- start:2184 stop:2861 length:678 start_codon:yes stop_codon:yes gene_type:complete